MKYVMIKLKLIFIPLFIMLLLFLYSCSNEINSNDEFIESDTKIASDSKIQYIYYDVFNISPIKIIVPKNQSIAQSLSIIVNDGKGNLIVFDGGRVEDADYLCDIILDNGGRVKTWFITHIHDDHIGALYKILNDKRTDIKIENLYYDFASFDWYYKKMGNDAGIYYLFTNAISEYNNYLLSINRNIINVYNEKLKDIKYYDFYNNDKNPSMNVKILNKHFELEQDPINNTSIAYEVEIFASELIKMLIFGDLGFFGGEILFNNSSSYNSELKNIEKLKNNSILNYSYKDYSNNIDIIVLSHHGQNGINPEIYKLFNPKVVIWPTSKDIYANTHGRYYTSDTKKVLSEIKSIILEIKSYEETAVLR